MIVFNPAYFKLSQRRLAICGAVVISAVAPGSFSNWLLYLLISSIVINLWDILFNLRGN